MTTDRDHLQPPHSHSVEIARRRRKLILCFDGTGNKFKGNAGDTNILKIFRMLDRSGPEQCRFFSFFSPSFRFILFGMTRCFIFFLGANLVVFFVTAGLRGSIHI